MDFWLYDFMRQAFLIGVIASIICGIIGSYVVVNRIVFISGSISHTAYGGIGLGYYLGFSPIIGATIFSLIAAIIIGMIGQRAEQRPDTVIGITWAVGMALGAIFVKLSPGYTADLMSYLFGNILTVPRMEMWYIFILSAIILGVVFTLYEDFRAVSFDEEFARVQGLPTSILNLILLCLVALTVVILIRIVGIILVIALLTIPAAIAIQCTSKLHIMMGISIILGICFTTGGLIISFFLDLPSGAVIIMVAALTFILAVGGNCIFSKYRAPRPGYKQNAKIKSRP